MTSPCFITIVPFHPRPLPLPCPNATAARPMNWTGGSFARSRNNPHGSLVRRQRQHFARARTRPHQNARRSISPWKLSFARRGSPPAGTHVHAACSSISPVRRDLAVTEADPDVDADADEAAPAVWPGPGPSEAARAHAGRPLGGTDRSERAKIGHRWGAAPVTSGSTLGTSLANPSSTMQRTHADPPPDAGSRSRRRSCWAGTTGSEPAWHVR